MVYQTLKYFIARTGVTLFLMATLGFFALYVAHEVAMPGAAFDDTVIEWTVAAVCVFLGFFVYGLAGEQLMLNAIHRVKDPGLGKNEDETIRQYEYALSLTYSSYFLPRKSRRFRAELVHNYAEYLLASGRMDPSATRIYLKAFLQNPRDSKFRAPLVAILGNWSDLSQNEIDLLLVILKAEDYRDPEIVDHLASVFLAKKQFTLKTQPLFLKALQNRGERARRIVEFALPLLLAKERADAFALNFYLEALTFHPPGEQTVREILARSFYGGQWRGADPALHDRCGEIFAELDKDRQETIARSEDEKRLRAGRKFKLIARDDLKELEVLKSRMGIEPLRLPVFKSLFVWLRQGLDQALPALGGAARSFASTGIGFKAASLGFAFLLVLGVTRFESLKEEVDGIFRKPPPPAEVPIAPPEPAEPVNVRKHTVQVAAVISQGQADRIVKNLRRKGVEGLYVAKSKRSAGGDWYKIRVGSF
ncbi:MAG: SPOR domain-containing protein, partial [Nitrospinae bacterium]|nr:SPOR domain-containing protein [Nitrospinota bacterium]